MNISVEEQILVKIKKAKKGTLFFNENFVSKANSDAVRKALERLVKASEIIRISSGVYVRPQTDPIIGQLLPSIDAVVKAIAKRDKARIVPTGSYALNKIGLSTQVPMNVVYLTDGAPRKITIFGRKVLLKKTSPKNLSAIGEISQLVIQALRTLGKDNITEAEIAHIQTLLRNEKPTRLEHDFRLAPAWIREIIRPILNENIHE